MRLRNDLAAGCSVAALAMMAVPTSGAAQDRAADPPAPQTGQQAEQDRRIIIVNGRRVLVTAADDEPVERSYDADAVAAYGVSTVGEIIDEIRAENGDSDPALLINGQPVNDPDDIANLPVEAIVRVDTLPQGSAQRVGGAPGQRAYNIVLKQSLRSATLTASREIASEGGWGNSRGEALFTYIKGRDRLNLTLRGAQSAMLFESERAFVPRTLPTPFSPIGNLLPATGGEIDPQLSALAGFPVGTVALPANNVRPSLGDLIAGTNRIHPAGDAGFRSLRGAARPIEVALAGSKQLAPWLDLSFNGRLSWIRNENLSGLPTARFLIPSLHPLTPFDSAATLAISDADRPLRSDSDARFRSISTTLNAAVGRWRATTSARWDERRFDYMSQFSAPLLGGANIVPIDINPFDGHLAARIPVSERLSRSRSTASALTIDAEGPVAKLWAGDVRLRVGGSAAWTRYRGEDFIGSRRLNRHEYGAKAGLTIPLTSGANEALAFLGDSEVALDLGRADLGRFGTLHRRSAALNWQLRDWLRLVASISRDDRAISPDLLSAPEVVTPNVPYFDPVTGDTVDVTMIYGGGGSLANEQLRSRSVALTLTPLRQYSLQIDAEYRTEDLRNQIGALPLPSAAIVAAFPDRFQRDADGVLIRVDNRSVNFARQRNEQIRLGLRFALPLSQAAPPPAARPAGTAAARRIPPLRLQVHLAHTLMLNSRTMIREGLPEIDLLKGGAIGLGGGQLRSVANGSLALTQGASGVRIEMRHRGASQLIVGTPADPDRLDFGALTTIDAKVFADFGQAFPKAKPLKGLRFTVAFDNILNQRQRVTDLSGATPQAYQPVRRDPVGRTVLFELRKSF